MEESKKIEENITQKILQDILEMKDISDDNLKSRIKDEINRNNYLNEDWQIDYAVERVFKSIKPKTENGLATASLVVGLISLGYATSFSSIGIVAIILGHLSLYKIKKYPDIYSNKKMAIAGLVLGYLSVAIGLCLELFKAYLLKKIS